MPQLHHYCPLVATPCAPKVILIRNRSMHLCHSLITSRKKSDFMQGEVRFYIYTYTYIYVTDFEMVASSISLKESSPILFPGRFCLPPSVLEDWLPAQQNTKRQSHGLEAAGREQDAGRQAHHRRRLPTDQDEIPRGELWPCGRRRAMSRP